MRTLHDGELSCAVPLPGDDGAGVAHAFPVGRNAGDESRRSVFSCGLRQRAAILVRAAEFSK